MALLFAALTVLHYLAPASMKRAGESLSVLGLERHALERILFLAPIAYAAFVFGLRGGMAALALALAAMLPRVFLISRYPRDALFETVVTVGIGILVNAWLEYRRREIGRREETIRKLEAVRRELNRVGRRYQEIFEKANDAIWIHDLQGRIITANEACTGVTGYPRSKMMALSVETLFAADELPQLREEESALLAGRAVKQPFERRIVKKDGTRAAVMLSVSLLGDETTPSFLHIARDISEERKMQESLRLYAGQIGRAHEEERKRIARELHDDTIQMLVAVSRHLDNVIGRNTRRGSSVRRSLEEVHAEIGEAMVRIRRFIQFLRPPILDFLGLLPALRELAESMRGQFGLEVVVEGGLQAAQKTEDAALARSSEREHEPPARTSEQELLIYRIVQEALQNAGKHSGASRAVIGMACDGGSCTITVRDNGGGFDLSEASELVGSGKLGLMGMRERAHLLGGSLEIRTGDAGTSVILRIPAASGYAG